jgi:hypothetical protein
MAWYSNLIPAKYRKLLALAEMLSKPGRHAMAVAYLVKHGAAEAWAEAHITALEETYRILR